jgi:hypothetical protein
VNKAPLDDPLAHLEPMSEADAVITISVILAAHSKEFPQLRGPGVGRHQTDEARHIFASKLVDHLRTGRQGLYRTVTSRPLMMDTSVGKDR